MITMVSAKVTCPNPECLSNTNRYNSYPSTMQVPEGTDEFRCLYCSETIKIEETK